MYVLKKKLGEKNRFALICSALRWKIDLIKINQFIIIIGNDFVPANLSKETVQAYTWRSFMHCDKECVMKLPKMWTYQKV